MAHQGRLAEVGAKHQTEIAKAGMDQQGLAPICLHPSHSNPQKLNG